MCKLLNLVTSDLVDEDYIRYDRTHSVSALIYGASALFAKPGQTIAPLVGTWLIARNVPGFLFSPEALLGGADVVNVRDLDSSQLSNMQDTMFTMLVYVQSARPISPPGTYMMQFILHEVVTLPFRSEPKYLKSK